MPPRLARREILHRFPARGLFVNGVSCTAKGISDLPMRFLVSSVLRGKIAFLAVLPYVLSIAVTSVKSPDIHCVASGQS